MNTIVDRAQLRALPPRSLLAEGARLSQAGGDLVASAASRNEALEHCYLFVDVAELPQDYRGHASVSAGEPEPVDGVLLLRSVDAAHAEIECAGEIASALKPINLWHPFCVVSAVESAGCSSGLDKTHAVTIPGAREAVR